MKGLNRFLSIALVMAAVAIGLFLALVAVPALSAPRAPAAAAPAPAQASTPTPIPGVIPLKPVSGLTSLNATVKLDVNGLINGKRSQGNLNALLTTTDQGKSKATVSGSLLGDIAAQVGGSLVGLFTPSQVDLYKVPDGAYVVVNGLFPVCIKPDTADATGALDDVNPSALLGMLTGSDVARGDFVGEETLNGTTVRHYVLNGDSFLLAAQNSTDPKLRAFGKALWSAKDADLYVDAEGGYPVAFRGNYSGAFEPLKFEGDFGVQIDLTGVNTKTRVDLPAACNKPISR